MSEKNNEISQNHDNISIGEILKNNRENANIDIARVANYLKVRANDIKSLENNDIEKIARNIYVPGLVKSYAKYLKIDAQIINEKIQELPLRSNVEIKKHTLINIGEDNKLSPSKDLAFKSLIISAILIFIFLMIFSSVENNVDLINTDSIISDIQKINN